MQKTKIIIEYVKSRKLYVLPVRRHAQNSHAVGENKIHTQVFPDHYLNY